MASGFPVVDLTLAPGALETRPTVDPEQIASQLKEITDAIAPVLATADTQQGFGLETVELSLTIGVEGGVWFVAKGSAEASIKVTFGRPEA
jgi:hypothetical protein